MGLLQDLDEKYETFSIGKKVIVMSMIGLILVGVFLLTFGRPLLCKFTTETTTYPDGCIEQFKCGVNITPLCPGNMDIVGNISDMPMIDVSNLQIDIPIVNVSNDEIEINNVTEGINMSEGLNVTDGLNITDNVNVTTIMNETGDFNVT